MGVQGGGNHNNQASIFVMELVVRSVSDFVRFSLEIPVNLVSMIYLYIFESTLGGRSRTP